MNIDIFFAQHGQVRQASALYSRLPHGAIIPCGGNRVRVRAWNDARTLAYETFAFSVGEALLPDNIFNPPLIIPAFAASIERRIVMLQDVAWVFAAWEFTLCVARGNNGNVRMYVNNAGAAYPAKMLQDTALQHVTVTLSYDELYALIDARRAVTRVRFGARGGWACLKTRNATLWKRSVAPTEHAS